MRITAKFIAIFASASLALNVPLWADDHDPDDREDERHSRDVMRGAVERGEAKPLSEILQIVREAYPGEIVGVEFEDESNGRIYEVKIADKRGHLLEVHVDAIRGRILETREK